MSPCYLLFTCRAPSTSAASVSAGSFTYGADTSHTPVLGKEIWQSTVALSLGGISNISRWRYTAITGKRRSPITCLNCTFWSFLVCDPNAELKTCTSRCLSWTAEEIPLNEHGGLKGEGNLLSNHGCQVQQRCRHRC